MILLLFALVSIVFSFLCSIWEAVLLSIPPSYVRIKLQEGTVTGQLLDEFKSDIDRPLSAILSLNTIAHTAGAIGVGALAGQTFGDGNLVIFGIETFSAEAWLGALMTLAILVLSEIIPKTLGATYWTTLAPFTVRSLKVLTTILLPLVWMSQGLTRLLKKDTQGSIFSRADFTAMAEIGAQEGVFQENEGRILRNLMRFETITVEDVMTPRTVVVASPVKISVGEFYERFKDTPFSRIPVFSETRDQITGFVLRHDVYKHMLEQKNPTDSLDQLRRDLVLVNEDTPLHDAFELMLQNREHIAAVVDKFGGLAGVITMEDAVETLLGMEIVDEIDDEVDMQQLARQKWRDRAKRMGLPVEEDPEEVPGQHETKATPKKKSSSTEKP